MSTIAALVHDRTEIDHVFVLTDDLAQGRRHQKLDDPVIGTVEFIRHITRPGLVPGLPLGADNRIFDTTDDVSTQREKFVERHDEILGLAQGEAALHQGMEETRKTRFRSGVALVSSPPHTCAQADTMASTLKEVSASSPKFSGLNPRLQPGRGRIEEYQLIPVHEVGVLGTPGDDIVVEGTVRIDEAQSVPVPDVLTDQIFEKVALTPSRHPKNVHVGLAGIRISGERGAIVSRAEMQGACFPAHGLSRLSRIICSISSFMFSGHLFGQFSTRKICIDLGEPFFLVSTKIAMPLHVPPNAIPHLLDMWIGGRWRVMGTTIKSSHFILELRNL